MRKASVLLRTALLLAAAPMGAQGQVLLGPTLAWHDDAGSFRPKAGGRFVIGDGTSFVLFITLPFRVGAR